MSRLQILVRNAWQRSSNPLLATTRRWYDGYLRRLFPFAISRTATGQLTIAYGGLPDGLSTILPFLEGQRTALAGPSVGRESGRLRWRDLRQPLWHEAADLAVIGCSARRARLLAADRALILPLRLHQVIDLASGRSGDGGGLRVSKKERQQFARNRGRHGWTWERSERAPDFDFFYERMHLPTMRWRHGAQALTADKRTVYECMFRNGHLFFVVENGARIAGAVCQQHKRQRKLTLWLVGLIDGDERYHRAGALAAVYHFLLEWATAEGFAQVDLAASAPFLSKGTYQFKRKFHPRVQLPPNHARGKRLCLRINRDSPAVRDFLVANPLLILDGGGLTAVYFHDESRCARTELRWESPGIRRALHLDLDHFLQPGMAGLRPGH